MTEQDGSDPNEERLKWSLLRALDSDALAYRGFPHDPLGNNSLINWTSLFVVVVVIETVVRPGILPLLRLMWVGQEARLRSGSQRKCCCCAAGVRGP
jgi:hypothetical protein